MSEPSLDVWSDLRSAGLIENVAAGEPVFREGDAADAAYVLLSGTCAVLEGDEHVHVLQPGELFGEIGAMGEGFRTATVVAVEDAEMIVLSLEQLREGFTASPELLWQALRVIVARSGQIKHREVAFRDEHIALRETQRSLLPDLTLVDGRGSFTVDAVWEPCTYASGDYYDVIPVDDQRDLFAVGDVMGHGAESSLMMAIARAQIRELARSFRRTDELLLNLDGYLRDNAPPKQGMSLFVGVYNRQTQLLEYSVAGHPLPLLWRNATLTDVPGRAGILLALPFLLGTGYERLELKLEHGDQLLVFTDGLFELDTAASGSQLGRDGLRALATSVLEQPSGSPLSALLARVADVDAAAHADDDRTALLLTIL